jgi:peptide/nickel transport system permease protein
VFAFVGRRLLQLPLLILAITFVTFGFSFISGDPSQQFIGQDWTQEEVAAFKRERGFDRPWVVQYLDFLGRAVQGDFGTSWRHNEPSFGLVLDRMPTTLTLAVLSLLLSLVIAIPLGVIAGTRRNTGPDAVAMLVALLAQSAPTFWVGIMLILVLAVYLGWLPVSGADTWLSFVLPVLALGTHFAGRTARLVRSSLLEVLHADYVRTARAKGLFERAVIYKHALRNALIPVVAVVGLDLGNMMAGSIVIESVFALPGVGRLALQALSTKDLPVLQAAMTLFALVFFVANLLTDLLYRALDPRIRLS